MNIFETIDSEELDENLGRRDVSKKAKHTLDPEKLSPEDILVGSSNVDNLNPEEIFMLKEEGKIIDSSSEPDKKNKSMTAFELDSDDELPNFENDSIHNEEVLQTTKEETVPKVRAAVASKKNDSGYHDNFNESYGKRGKEPKGKFKKGLESIKRLLKIN